MNPGPRILVAGLTCLVAAQALAWWVIAPRRQELAPQQEIFAALTPGEFAGTLMLGGFRGLACDLLWMRADSAKQNGRFYESVALFQAISRIQPRFEQPWQYMAWDLAYNLSHEVEDRRAKWSWIQAGIETAIRGFERNPHSEKLLRHLAWLFHHKGDLFHDEVEAAKWAPVLAPVLAEVNRQVLPAYRHEQPPEPGASNFAISALLYRCCIALADGRTDGHGYLSAQFVRRMIPLALESDGNIRRNQGRHLVALKAYLDSLKAWQEVRTWNEGTPKNEGDANQRSVSAASYERNEGRLRRKTARLAEDLAKNPETGSRCAQAILDRDYAIVDRELLRPVWKDVANHQRLRWLDE